MQQDSEGTGGGIRIMSEPMQLVEPWQIILGPSLGVGAEIDGDGAVEVQHKFHKCSSQS